MQLARMQEDGTIDVIGSDDSSTLFANAVIDLKQRMTIEQGNVQDFSQNTPNPLSAFLLLSTF